MPRTQHIRYEQGGRDGPLIVLLHGLGANGAVWERWKPILAAHWPGRWIIPDFRGHGRSSHRSPYTVETHASDVAALLAHACDVTLVGHSMGGLVAIALASGAFGVRPRRVFAFAVKTRWTADELARAEAVAQAPAKLFETRAGAVDRYLKISGLQELVDPESPMASAGITEEQGRFRLAADPWTNTLGEPDIERIAAAALTPLHSPPHPPLHLFCGEHDRIANGSEMQDLGRDVTVLPGLGHNLHVQAPEILWRAIEARLGPS